MAAHDALGLADSHPTTIVSRSVARRCVVSFAFAAITARGDLPHHRVDRRHGPSPNAGRFPALRSRCALGSSTAAPEPYCAGDWLVGELLLFNPDRGAHAASEVMGCAAHPRGGRVVKTISAGQHHRIE